jgi:hypothetical protein
VENRQRRRTFSLTITLNPLRLRRMRNSAECFARPFPGKTPRHLTRCQTPAFPGVPPSWERCRLEYNVCHPLLRRSAKVIKADHLICGSTAAKSDSSEVQFGVSSPWVRQFGFASEPYSKDRARTGRNLSPILKRNLFGNYLHAAKSVKHSECAFGLAMYMGVGAKVISRDREATSRTRS